MKALYTISVVFFKGLMYLGYYALRLLGCNVRLFYCVGNKCFVGAMHVTRVKG